MLAAWVFPIRDTAVILALNLRARAKPANGLVAVYLILAYFVLPAAGVPGLLPALAPANEQVGLPMLQAAIA